MSFNESFIVYNPNLSKKDTKKLLTFVDDDEEEDDFGYKAKTDQELLASTYEPLRKFFLECIQTFPPYLSDFPEEMLPKDIDEYYELMYDIQENHIGIGFFADIYEELHDVALNLVKKYNLGLWYVNEQELIFKP
jgi:hypothetical protein